MEIALSQIPYKVCVKLALRRRNISIANSITHHLLRLWKQRIFGPQMELSRQIQLNKIKIFLGNQYEKRIDFGGRYTAGNNSQNHDDSLN